MHQGEHEADIEVTFEEIEELLAGTLDEHRAVAVRAALLEEPELLRAVYDAKHSEQLAEVADLSSGEIDDAWEAFSVELATSADIGKPAPSERPAVAPLPSSRDGGRSSDDASSRRHRRLRAAKRSRWFRPTWRDVAAILVGAGLVILLPSFEEEHLSEAVFLEQLSPRSERPLQRGESPETPRLILSPETGRVVLLLVPPASLDVALPTSPTYRLLRHDVQVLAGWLRVQDEGVFAMTFEQEQLPQGAYTLELTNQHGAEALARYDFMVVPRDDRLQGSPDRSTARPLDP